MAFRVYEPSAARQGGAAYKAPKRGRHELSSLSNRDLTCRMAQAAVASQLFKVVSSASDVSKSEDCEARRICIAMHLRLKLDPVQNLTAAEKRYATLGIPSIPY